MFLNYANSIVEPKSPITHCLLQSTIVVVQMMPITGTLTNHVMFHISIILQFSIVS